MIKLNITKIDHLLNSDLSLQQRGFLITCILLRDKTPELTYAKIKASVKLNKIKDDLISLHENDFISWKGYEKEIKSKQSQEINPQVIEIIDFMNELYGRKFKVTSSTTTKELKNRLLEFSVDDVKAVIANRYAEWKDDEVMRKYLTPYTIFRKSKFEKYLEDAESTSTGKDIIVVDDLGLRTGDEITLNISEKLKKELLYSVTEFKLSSGGEELGIGTLKSIKGSDINGRLKRQQRRIKHGERPDFILRYN